MSMLFVFEGADGTGKSTAARWLYDYLKDEVPPQMSVHLEFEPTSGVFGQAIRAGGNGAAAEAALFMTDRLRHVRETINPLMEKPYNHIILDRYYYSTVAYQSSREDLDLDATELLKDAEFFCPRPNVLFLFECDINVAMQRIDSRGERDKTFETVAYQQRVQKAFRDTVPAGTRIIDTTTLDENGVQIEVAKALSDYSVMFSLLMGKFLLKNQENS